MSHASQLVCNLCLSMRSRWKSVVRDLSLILIGLLVGLCITQYMSVNMAVVCSSSSIERIHQQREEVRTESNTESTSIESSETNTVNTDQLSKSNIIRTFNNQIDENLKRPKYLRQELHICQPLYIGVVTATEFLDTRARDVNNTWGKKAPKIEYFASESHGSHSLPVVSLPGVDDTYPPQKKVYRMLRYMHDHYINDYNWFMRADDDVYVRIPELLNFLSKLDPSEDLYIGSPGFGRDNDLERIKLYPHERYCMGGPGVIFSRGLLIKLVPHLEDCLENVVVSWNEDLEVGRCISRKLNVQCTWAYEVKKTFYSYCLLLLCVFLDAEIILHGLQ